jgi:hypothetical protein
MILNLFSYNIHAKKLDRFILPCSLLQIRLKYGDPIHFRLYLRWLCPFSQISDYFENHSVSETKHSSLFIRSTDEEEQEFNRIDTLD